MSPFHHIIKRESESSLIPSSSQAYPTNSKGCLICPTTPPLCPACPSGQVCNLSLQSCNECPSVQCIPINNQVFTSPSTTTSASVSSTSTSAPSSTGNTHMIGPVIGGTVGGVLVVLIISLSLLWCIRRRRAHNRLEIHSIDGDDEKHPYPISPHSIETESSLSKEIEGNSFSIMHKSNYSDKSTLQKSREKTRKKLNNNGVRAISQPRILSSTYKEPTVAINKSSSVKNINKITNGSSNNDNNNNNNNTNNEYKFHPHLQTTRENFKGKFISSARTSQSSDMYNYHIVRTSTYNQSPTTPVRQVIPSFSNRNSSVRHTREMSESSDFSVSNNSSHIIPIAYIPGVTSRPMPNNYQAGYGKKNKASSQLLYSHYESPETSSFTSMSDTYNYNTPYENATPYRIDTVKPEPGEGASTPTGSLDFGIEGEFDNEFRMLVDSEHFEQFMESSDEEYDSIHERTGPFR